MSDTIELVRFRLQQGKSAADWLAIDGQLNDWVKAQPGFRFRSLSETGDGEWLDMVYWESPAAAAAAGEKFGAEMMAICMPLLEPGSVVISRSRAHVMQPGSGNG